MEKNIICCIFILIIFSNLHGQGIPYGQEFQVNTYNQDWQSAPQISVFSDNRFIVVWASASDSYSTFCIFAQQFTSDCEKIEPEFQIAMTSYPLITGNPVVAILSDSCFVVCWKRWELGLESYDNIGQLFKIPYIKIGNEFLISSGKQRSPFVAASNNNSFLACWSDYAKPYQQSDILGQLYDSSGQPFGNGFKINTNSQGLPSDPSVAALSNGNYVVCWQRSDRLEFGIMGQLIDASGTKVGGEFQISEVSQHVGTAPSVAAISRGGFAVCWYTSERRIKVQFFDESEHKKGDELLVYAHGSDYPNYPDVAELSNGDFIIAWGIWTSESSRNGIFGQLYDQFGVRKYGQFKMNNQSLGQEMGPVIGMLSGIGFMICWQSSNSARDDSDIFGKCISVESRKLALQEFSLLDPLNDATKDISKISFRWQQATNASESYPWEVVFNLYIDNSPEFTNPRIIRDNQDTTYTIDSLSAGKTYFWKVLAKNLAGDSLWSKQQDWGFFIKPGATFVATAAQNLPTDFELFQNYPNPFNSCTEIRYSLPQDKSTYHVTLKIYDIMGRLVNVLVNQNQAAGTYSIIWEGKDMNDNEMTSGVYFYTLQIKDFRMTKKMLFLE